jgi:hypothetical protein
MDTNPILQELSNLSPQAQQALQGAHEAVSAAKGGPAVRAASPQPAGPAPSPGQMVAPHMQSQVPQMGAPAQPNVPAPRGTLQGEQANVSSLMASHPGVDQIHNPVEHGIAKVGDVLGSALVPRIAQQIPGTTAQHNLLLRQGEGNVNTLLGNNQKEAQTAQEQATTGHTNAETAAMPEQEADRHALTESTINKNEQDKAVTLQQMHANAVNKAIQEGRDPSSDPTVQHLADAITGLQKQGAPPKEANPQQQFYDSEIKAGKTPKQAYEETKEKPATINVNAGNAALDRELKQYGAPHQKAVDSANAQLEKIADAKAMINGNAESQALGIPKVLTALVSGQGSGVRITQPELNAIAKARGWGGDLEGTLNSISGKGKLTDTQKQQLSQILDDVHTRIQQKAAIASDALDKMSAGGSREQIIQADKEARQKLTQMESGGEAAKEGDTKVNSAGDRVVFKGGKWGPA